MSTDFSIYQPSGTHTDWTQTPILVKLMMVHNKTKPIPTAFIVHRIYRPASVEHDLRIYTFSFVNKAFITDISYTVLAPNKGIWNPWLFPQPVWSSDYVSTNHTFTMKSLFSHIWACPLLSTMLFLIVTAMQKWPI